MTEQGAMDILLQDPLYQYECDIEEHRRSDLFNALSMAIKALEEVQQYRAIGIPEECRAAVDKQTAKKPCKENTIWYCPECGEEIYWDTDYGQQKFRYCPDCGKKLNWSEEQ